MKKEKISLTEATRRQLEKIKDRVDWALTELGAPAEGLRGKKAIYRVNTMDTILNVEEELIPAIQAAGGDDFEVEWYDDREDDEEEMVEIVD